ncbi:MAG: tetratricopeptide repeat protein, partial [Acidobacteriota bacterium]
MFRLTIGKTLFFLLLFGWQTIITSAQVGTADPQFNSVEAYNRALKQQKARRYNEAVETLKTIIERSPAFNRAYARLNIVYNQAGQPEAAENYYQSLLGKDPQNAYPYYGLALFHKINASERAQTYITKCIELAPGFTAAYSQLVEIAINLKKGPEVEKLLVNAIQADPNNAAAHYGLGHLYVQTEKLTDALAPLNEALRLDKRPWQPYYDKYYVYRETQKTDELNAWLKVMLAKAEESNDLEWKCIVSAGLGYIQSYLGDYQQVLKNSQQAIAITREIELPGIEPVCLTYIGVVYQYTGRPQEALDAYQQAARLAREISYKELEGRTIGLIADIHTQLANYSPAISGYLQAAEIAQQRGDLASQASQLGSVSLVYSNLGDPDQALKYIESALKIVEKIDNPAQQGYFLEKRATIYSKLQKNNQALDDYSEALRIAKVTGNKRDEAVRLTYIGQLHAANAKYAEARQCYQNALKVAAELTAPVGTKAVATVEEQILLRLAELEFKLENSHEAEENYKKSLAIAIEKKTPETILQAEAGLAALYESTSRLDEAFTHYRQAIEAIEQVRSQLTIDEEKAGFFQDKVDIYKHLITLLARLADKDPTKGYQAEAFYYTERSRARALLDLMAEAKVNIDQDIDATLRQRQQEIQNRITYIQASLIKEYQLPDSTAAKIKNLQIALNTTDEERQNLQREIRRQHPRYATLQYPEPIRLAQVQQLLDEHSVLLSYSLGEKESLLFAVSREKNLVIRLSPATTIVEQVKRLRELLIKPGRTTFSSYLKEARALYRELIQPADSLLTGKQHLIVVPDGILHYLPFEVLLKSDTKGISSGNWRLLPYMVRDYSISYAPSASVLASLLEEKREIHSSRKMFLAYADPIYPDEKTTNTNAVSLTERSLFADGKPLRFGRLTKSGEEVNGIARLFSPDQVTVFLRKQANEENVK